MDARAGETLVVYTGPRWIELDDGRVLDCLSVGEIHLRVDDHGVPEVTAMTPSMPGWSELHPEWNQAPQDEE